MLDGARMVLEKRRTAPMADPGTVIQIVSWILLVIAICVLIARFAMKLSMRKKGRKLGLDDLFICLAALFSIGQTVAVSVEATHALGQHLGEVKQNQITIFQKAEYASCMLYIANMGCARISLCLLIKKVLPGRTPSYSALVFAGFTALWMISGIFVTAFPCSPPHPWRFVTGKKCMDLSKYVNYVGITNIVVEVLLVMIPLFVWNIRLTAGKRVSVSCVFLSRLSIVAAVGAQLHFFNRYVWSPDFTYDYWRTELCVQIAQNLSIITACLPCLHPFIISILVGATKTDELVYKCNAKKSVHEFLRKKGFKVDFDPTSSQSSTMPITEKTDKSDYCRPLATYGLDRSSAHLNSQHFNRFPVSNTAMPLAGPDPPENVFMRSVEIPIAPSRPVTSSSKEPPPPPKNLSDVGVLPIIDWDTESSDRDSGRDSAGRDSPSRRPTSAYTFRRSKVISVPEEPGIEDGQYWKRYYPPLPSPKLPKRHR